MKLINKEINDKYTDLHLFNNFIDQKVTLKGNIHKVRNMKEFSFIILRTERELIQCIFSKQVSNFDIFAINEGDFVIVDGIMVKDNRSKSGYEIQINNIEVLSSLSEDLPFTINSKVLDLTTDTKLKYRSISLRHPKERAIFKIQEGIVRGFRDYLYKQNFTEIHTPKLVSNGAEGGANVFELDYFGKKAYLAQSPQIYKQAMVGVFDRVFEVAPVFRAEKHSTNRHLNEYISLDLEMGFIDSYEEIMKMETAMLSHIISLLNDMYRNELNLFNVELPIINEIPAISFNEAKKILSQINPSIDEDHDDLSPEEERLLGKHAKDNYNSDFLFITKFPSSKRPFYTMNDKENEMQTLSFDLLFKGIEITTGGQRIHDYEMQLEKLISRGLNPVDFENYLIIHKYGIPPHGGLGLGLERLTMKLLNLNNAKLASLFPRDINRLTP
ncbi:aspartate--tRNA(Asn) ligase [Metasolibacillus meyeri]|uniref:Aspartate--tRNA ligase n=1 Tax=Metasolibacillus meyeri TaxID=1071052 RepID=A0AAW9NMN2_9BACL|nr:aspartate--tRNA(Asn) ligase [Metasolibacillus meyeri]MEC1178650.1 aspartate--tRNA(Asn) ligase [Metasolibacillus meyeri]